MELPAVTAQGLEQQIDELRRGQDELRREQPEMRKENAAFREQMLAAISGMRAEFRGVKVTLEQHNERIRALEAWFRAMVLAFIGGWLAVIATQSLSAVQLARILQMLSAQ